MSPVAWAQTDGLIGYWNFDEGEGLLIHDRSGNHHHGSLKDAQWVKGKIGHALEFVTEFMSRSPIILNCG